MMRVDVTRIPASGALRLSLLAGLLAVVGCSGPVSNDKRDDPALKASMQKRLEIYKSKTQVSGEPLKPSKGYSQASKGYPGKPHPAMPRRRP
jgi:hypothetical protein